MDSIFSLQINQIVLSQLYINSVKLDIILNFFKEKREHDLEPIPIKRLDDNLVATDGHTRLLAWYLNGYKEVACAWEDVELDWDAYRICIQWCRDEGIESIADLQDRIVDTEAYQQLWLDRCRIMQEELEANRVKQSK